MSNGPITSKESFLKNASALCDQIRDNGAKPILYVTRACQKGSEQLASFGMNYGNRFWKMMANHIRWVLLILSGMEITITWPVTTMRGKASVLSVWIARGQGWIYRKAEAGTWRGLIWHKEVNMKPRTAKSMELYEIMLRRGYPAEFCEQIILNTFLFIGNRSIKY